MVKWNFIVLRFWCLGCYESLVLCEVFVRMYWCLLCEKDFFLYYFRIVLAMYEFGVIDRAGVVYVFRVVVYVIG